MTEGLSISLVQIIAQVINIGLVVLYIVVFFVSVGQLARAQLSEAVRLGWAALIIFVPLLGAIAFLVIRPGRRPTSS